MAVIGKTLYGRRIVASIAYVRKLIAWTMPKRRALHDEDELEPWERPRQWKRTKPADENDDAEQEPEDCEE